jgi:flagellar biosynthesis/type III secretory pathway protein FliH
LFRIDRNLVNVSSVRTLHLNRVGDEAGAEGGERLNTAASVVSTAGYTAVVEYESELNARALEIKAREKELEKDIANTLEKANAQARDIISEAEVQAKKSADDIIVSAREEASTILIEARENVEEDRKRAMQEGFAEGAEEGKRSFDAQLGAKLREDDERLKRVIEELYDERAQTYDGLEDEVIGLSMEIVRKIVSPAEDSLDAFRSLIENALRQLKPEGKITMRISLDDYERFFPSGSATFELSSGVAMTASVQRDAVLAQGDCIIDTGDITINAGLETQLKHIELAFKQLTINN